MAEHISLVCHTALWQGTLDCFLPQEKCGLFLRQSVEARPVSVHQTLPGVMGGGDIWWLSPISVSLKDPGRGSVCNGSKPVRLW